jgi:hypothetical protein
MKCLIMDLRLLFFRQVIPVTSNVLVTKEGTLVCIVSIEIRTCGQIEGTHNLLECSSLGLWE